MAGFQHKAFISKYKSLWNGEFTQTEIVAKDENPADVERSAS